MPTTIDRPRPADQATTATADLIERTALYAERRTFTRQIEEVAQAPDLSNLGELEAFEQARHRL